MTVYLILIAVLIFIGYLLYTPVRLRLRLAESEKYIRFSYSIIGVVFDIRSMMLRFFIDGIRIYTMDIRKTDVKKKDKKIKKVKKEKRPGELKIKKKKGFRLPDFWFEYLKGARDLVGNIRLEFLNIKIRGGIFDPFYTGKMYAYYWAAKGAFPQLMSHVDFRPDFSSETVQIEGKGVVYLRMYYILKVGFSILAVMIKEKMANLFTFGKRGPSYG